MYFLAAITGLAAGAIVWFTASRWIAILIIWVEDHRRELGASKRLRAAEVVVCGGLFIACLALAFFIMRVLWIEMK